MQERELTFASIQDSLLKKISALEQSMTLKLNELDALDVGEVRRQLSKLQLDYVKAV